VIKTSPVPFFIRPITNGIVNKVTTFFLKPNFETHYKFLESQLETSPDSGQFLCGKDLTAADILLGFPLEVGESRSGMSKDQFPRVYEYVARLHEQDGYKRAVKKIEEVEGAFKTHL
jgi:glutathione S-transferase